MKDFLKQNWFKIGILFIVVCIASYYFIIIFPQISNVKNQERCKDYGERAYNEDSVRYGVNNMMEPLYVFNEKLNLCLYSGGYYWGSADSGWERWVKNSFTNEHILAISDFKDAKGKWVVRQETIEKFWEEHKRLMGS